jgi:hypothetical protein
VLEPYAAEPTGWRRLLVWLSIPTLSLACLVAGFIYALTTPYMIPQFLAPIILLALVIIWALPDMRRAPTRLLGKLFFSFLTAVLIWPNYLAITLPHLPWITAVRLIGFPTALVLLICVSVSPELRSDMRKVLTSIPWLWQLMVGFIALQVLSVTWSDGKGDSINGLVDTQVSWTVMFFTACYVFTQKGAAERWAIIMWVAAIILCFVGLWEAKLEHAPWAGHIPSFLQVQDTYVQEVLKGARRLGTGKYRVQTTHSTSLGLAEFLALTAPFVIHFMMGQYKRWVQIAAGLSLPFMFYTILATDARLGVVGFFIAIMLYALCWGVMRWRDIRGSLMGPTVVLAYPAAAAVFVAATFFVRKLHNMVWGGSHTQFSNGAREEQVAAGIPKILSHPWGYGINRGAGALNFRMDDGKATIDTYYLLIGLDYGVVGFLVYYSAILVVIGFCAKYGLRAAPPEREETLLIPTGIALSAFFVIKSIFSQTENHTLQYMMMGMAAALIYRIRSRPGPDAGAPTRVPGPKGSAL